LENIKPQAPSAAGRSTFQGGKFQASNITRYGRTNFQNSKYHYRHPESAEVRRRRRIQDLNLSVYSRVEILRSAAASLRMTKLPVSDLKNWSFEFVFSLSPPKADG